MAGHVTRDGCCLRLARVCVAVGGVDSALDTIVVVILVLLILVLLIVLIVVHSRSAGGGNISVHCCVNVERGSRSDSRRGFVVGVTTSSAHRREYRLCT